jgi:hypothetical protein
MRESCTSGSVRGRRAAPTTASAVGFAVAGLVAMRSSPEDGSDRGRCCCRECRSRRSARAASRPATCAGRGAVGASIASSPPVCGSSLPLSLLAKEKATVPGLAAVMREAQEVEHLRSCPALAPTVFFGKPSELDQPRLVLMELDTSPSNDCRGGDVRCVTSSSHREVKEKRA